MSGQNAACLQKWPSQRSADLVLLNRGHGVLVGMGVKLRGQIMHMNHGHGPGLCCAPTNFHFFVGIALLCLKLGHTSLPRVVIQFQQISTTLGRTVLLMYLGKKYTRSLEKCPSFVLG